MSMPILERAIVTGARIMLKNLKLKRADIISWSTSEDCASRDMKPGEICVRVPDPGVYILVKAEKNLAK